MITGNAAWTAALASEYKQAFYALEIPSQGLTLTTFLPAWVSGTPAGALPILYIPSGLGQSVNELEGASSLSGVDIVAIDPTNALKPIVAAQNMIGSVAQLKLGFAGLSYSDFVVIATLQVFRAGWDASGRVTITLHDLQRWMKYWAWQNGGPSAWSLGQATPAQPAGLAFAANAQPCSDSNPRFIQGNPMDILLVALQNELGVGQTSDDPTTWTLYDPVANTGLINPNTYIDVPAILALRDGLFSGDWMEFKITGPEEGKSWIETEILKPLGLYSIARASGLLALKSMKTPVSQSALESWSDHDTLSIPTIDRLEPINLVTVRMNVDDRQRQTAARTFTGEVTFQQTTSIQRYRQQYQHQVESRGWRAERGGMARGFMLANRIFRRHAFGTPVYTVEVQLRCLRPELGDYVSLTHPLVIDFASSGALGISGVICEVIDRQPDYPSAKLTYKLIDTRFIGLSTAYQIAPASARVPAWASASAAQQAQYFFIAEPTGKYSDGTAAHRIF